MNLLIKDPASIAVILSVLMLLAGYSLRGAWLLALPVLGLGLIWLLGQRRGWSWLVSLGMAVFIGMAGLGLYIGAAAIWMLLATLGALAAWDLAFFARRLAQTPNVVDAAAIKQAHWRRWAGSLNLALARRFYWACCWPSA
jgi:hypothetical protein